MSDYGHIRQVSTEDLFDEYLLTQSSLALDELIRRFTPFARGQARKYYDSFKPSAPCEEDDFIAWAIEAVWSAIKSFDQSKSNPNNSLASSMQSRISAHIHRHVIDQYRIVLGNRYARSLAMAHAAYLDRYYVENGYYPTYEEIEAELTRELEEAESGTREDGKKIRSGNLHPTEENIRKSLAVNAPSLTVEYEHSSKTEDPSKALDDKWLVDQLIEKNIYGLTFAERDMLASLMRGMTDAQAGAALGLKESTCGNVRRAAMKILIEKERVPID